MGVTGNRFPFRQEVRMVRDTRSLMKALREGPAIHSHRGPTDRHQLIIENAVLSEIAVHILRSNLPSNTDKKNVTR